MSEPQAIHRPGAARREPHSTAPHAADVGFSAWLVALASLAVVSIALLGFYWSAAANAVAVWYNSRAYNHGFLILPIVLYLIFERRRNLEGLAPAPWPLA